MDQLPGKPCHFKVSSDKVEVFFELVPWPIIVEDIQQVMIAFAAKDWAGLQQIWWDEHPYLRHTSAKLMSLAGQIEAETLYTAESLMSFGCLIGLYGPWDLDQLEQDLRCLSLLPERDAWPVAGDGIIEGSMGEGHTAWLGKRWVQAFKTDRSPDVQPLPAADGAFGLSL